MNYNNIKDVIYDSNIWFSFHPSNTFTIYIPSWIDLFLWNVTFKKTHRFSDGQMTDVALGFAQNKDQKVQPVFSHH